MNFNEYIIDDSDYDFFASLPKDEKLLFVYDLICDDYYGSGSIENTKEFEIEDSDASKYLDDTIFDEFDPKIHEIIAASLNEKADVNILILNNKLVLNSNSEELLNDTILGMFMDGMILSTVKLNESAMKNFHLLTHCKIYTIVGKEDGFSKN